MRSFKNVMFWAACAMALGMVFSSCGKDEDKEPVVKEWVWQDVNTFDLEALEGTWVNVAEERETISFTNVTEYEGHVAWVYQDVKSGTMSKVTNYENTVFFYLGQDHYRLVLTWNNEEKSQFSMRSMEGDYVGSHIAGARTFKKVEL